jgi:hypothetical protein
VARERRASRSTIKRAASNLTQRSVGTAHAKETYTGSVGSHEISDYVVVPPPSKVVWKQPQGHAPAQQQQQQVPPLRPNRRREADEERGVTGPASDEIEMNVPKRSRYNPLVHNYTSPIGVASCPFHSGIVKLIPFFADIAYASASPREPKYTFTRNMA